MPELSAEQKEMLAKQKENCPFCKIIAGEIPSKQVYEDDQIIALLDIHPATPGNILVMPKEHYPIMPLIPEETFAHLFKIVRELSARLREAMLVSRTTIFIANGYAAGQNSQHFLFHIIPREEVDSLDMLYIKGKEIEIEKYNEAYKILSHNLPIMLRNRYKLFSIEGKEAPKLKYTFEQVRQIIEKNPKLKELIQQNPNEFRKLSLSHEQLKPVFAEVNVDEVIKEYVKDYTPTEKRKEEKEKERKEKSEDKYPIIHEETGEKIKKGEEVKEEAEGRLEDDLIEVLNANPKLKSLLINDFETFRQKVNEIDKLKEVFFDADLNKLRSRVIELEKEKNAKTKSQKLTKEKEYENKKSERKAETKYGKETGKEQEDVNLDDITRLLS